VRRAGRRIAEKSRLFNAPKRASRAFARICPHLRLWERGGPRYIHDAGEMRPREGEKAANRRRKGASKGWKTAAYLSDKAVNLSVLSKFADVHPRLSRRARSLSERPKEVSSAPEILPRPRRAKA